MTECAAMLSREDNIPRLLEVNISNELSFHLTHLHTSSTPCHQIGEIWVTPSGSVTSVAVQLLLDDCVYVAAETPGGISDALLKRLHGSGL